MAAAVRDLDNTERDDGVTLISATHTSSNIVGFTPGRGSVYHHLTVNCMAGNSDADHLVAASVPVAEIGILFISAPIIAYCLV